MPGSGTAGKRVGGSVFARLALVLRRISGMPDYPAYLEHLRLAHPDRPALTEREYYDMYLRTRYGDSPTRCC